MQKLPGFLNTQPIKLLPKKSQKIHMVKREQDFSMCKSACQYRPIFPFLGNDRVRKGEHIFLRDKP